LDFSRVFALPPVPADVPRLHTSTQDHGLDKALDVRLIEKAKRCHRARRKSPVHGRSAQR
jgi:hypothetical protein